MDQTIKLTAKEAKLLKEYLSLDLDAIGYSEREQKILRAIFDKIK